MNKQRTMGTNLDDWDTDPDIVHDMDEMHQRWGSKRTIGSVNMNELIDEVRREHKQMRDQMMHSSQKDHSEGFGGKFGIQHDRKDESALGYDYHEKLSKHTSQEVCRKIITTSSSNISTSGGSSSKISDAKRTFMESSTQEEKTKVSPLSTSHATRSENPPFFKNKPQPPPSPAHLKEKLFKESSLIRTSKETKSSNTDDEKPRAMKSIFDKMDSFRRDFDDIKEKVSRGPDMSKITKRVVEDVSDDASGAQILRTTATTTYSPERIITERPTSSSPQKSIGTFEPIHSPSRMSPSPQEPSKGKIKSLSEKFESLGRKERENFSRETEARRAEEFNEIKKQVRDTRKNLEGFDPVEETPEKSRVDHNKTDSKSFLHREDVKRYIDEKFNRSNESVGRQSNISSSSRPSSRASRDSDHDGKAKVITRHEVTEERIQSKLVKENDKIIEDITKRNVEKRSSIHGDTSSEDEGTKEHSIKSIDKNLRTSPQERVESPVEKVKRENPVIEPKIKGSGLMARTLYDYQANEPDELTFDVDELITNIEKLDPGWYKGIITHKNGIKEEGLFPANYVKLLNEAGQQ